MEPAVRDTRGRALRDLRVSVTDRCNFRCGYCMPKSVFGPDHRFLPAESLLTFDEIARVVEASVALGVSKVRLTGGEPLLRAGLDQLVARLSRVPGLRDLALTTNGARLAAWARPLREAGLGRVTVSLDSLSPERFARLSGVDASLDDVLEGIEAARSAGFQEIRINSVVRRSDDPSDFVELARRFRGTGITVRFIEYMDVGGTVGWSRADVVPASEIVERLSALGDLVPVAASVPGATARRYVWADGSGEIGIIPSITQPFCGDCVRLRLSSDGTLYTCLFATEGLPMGSALRQGLSVEEVTDRIGALWSARSDRYSELRDEIRARGTVVQLRPKIGMAAIGG